MLGHRKKYVIHTANIHTTSIHSTRQVVKEFMTYIRLESTHIHTKLTYLIVVMLFSMRNKGNKKSLALACVLSTNNLKQAQTSKNKQKKKSSSERKKKTTKFR